MNVQTAWTALALWFGVVCLHGLWRSRGEGTPDPIRPSGPLDQM